MTLRWMVSLLFLSACERGLVVPDASGDAGVVWEDGGVIEAAGGCYRRQAGEKFILYFETDDPICAAVSFRRFDGGFAPAFRGGPWPQHYILYDDGGFGPAEPWADYEIDDARVGLCSMPYEQSDGRLNQAAARLEDFRATLTIEFQVGRAIGYQSEGSLAFFGKRYRFSTGPNGAGLADVCVGP
ncbi:MAG: hypothetical protein ACO1OB_13700 [Archangium sp.]